MQENLGQSMDPMKRTPEQINKAKEREEAFTKMMNKGMSEGSDSLVKRMGFDLRK